MSVLSWHLLAAALGEAEVAMPAALTGADSWARLLGHATPPLPSPTRAHGIAATAGTTTTRALLSSTRADGPAIRQVRAPPRAAGGARVAARGAPRRGAGGGGGGARVAGALGD